MTRIATYLINLDGSRDRLAAATAHLGERGLAFERLPAVDGRAFGPADVPAYEEARALAYMGRKVMGAELGCYLSHLNCAKALLASDADCALVFEDDITVSPDLMAVVRQAVDWLATSDHSDWRLINLGSPVLRMASPVRQITAEHGRYDLSLAHYFPMGAIALCWSRRGAAEFVAHSARITAPVDNTFHHWLTRTGGGLAIQPPLARITGAASDIEPDSPDANRRRRFGRSRLYGLRKQRRLWRNRFWALLHRARHRLGFR
jgi:glycosyl transferase family 25